MRGFRHHRQREEDGMVLVYALVLVVATTVIIALMMLNSNQSARSSRAANNRVLTYPHVQNALTRFRMALGARLATDADGYTLSLADLTKLAPSAATAPGFISSGNELPPEFRAVAGVWSKTTPTTIAAASGFPMQALAYHEPATVSADACSALGMSTATCNERVHGFWQVYRVEMPDHTSLDSNGNVVVYLRAWLQAVDANLKPTGPVAEASVVRAELRPGRFADFQLISDGPIKFGRGATISGPVHSNGFDNSDTYAADGTVHDSSGAAAVAVDVAPGVACGDSAAISSAQGRINKPGGVQCPSTENTNRFLSFLRVFDELDILEADSRRPGTAAIQLPGYDQAGVAAQKTAWQAWLEGNRIRMLSPTGETRIIPAGTGTTAVLVQDDIVLHGGDLDGRVTLAARRIDAGTANIYIDGNVNDGTRNANVSLPGRTLGLIAQGDIIIDMQGGTGSAPVVDCRVTFIRAALLAASGGVTIPPQYTVPQTQPGPPQCDQQLTIDGSIAGHRAPNMNWAWPSNDGTAWAGYDKRSYKWDTRLLSSPPPYFPLTGTWQAVNVRPGNVDCYAGSR
ncbi:MAG: hypothetical protein JWN72_1607, partial [Thermoleophilia bacterium]|nr:hypothetical protein [Thermoleophilia bacterium]